jgi:hypothetical protein
MCGLIASLSRCFLSFSQAEYIKMYAMFLSIDLNAHLTCCEKN